MFIFGFVLTEWGMALEKFIQHATETEPVSTWIVRCTFWQYFRSHVTMGTSEITVQTWITLQWTWNEATELICPSATFHLNAREIWNYLDLRNINTITYTLAWGFFLEKSQANPRSDIRTWPCSSSNMLAGLRSLYTIYRLCICSKPNETVSILTLIYKVKIRRYCNICSCYF